MTTKRFRKRRLPRVTLAKLRSFAGGSLCWGGDDMRVKWERAKLGRRYVTAVDVLNIGMSLGLSAEDSRRVACHFLPHDFPLPSGIHMNTCWTRGRHRIGGRCFIRAYRFHNNELKEALIEYASRPE